MPDTVKGKNSNRNPKYYDLPDLTPDRNLRHDGMTAPGNFHPNEQGGEYQVGSDPKMATTPVDPHSFAAAGGFSATL